MLWEFLGGKKGGKGSGKDDSINEKGVNIAAIRNNTKKGAFDPEKTFSVPELVAIIRFLTHPKSHKPVTLSYKKDVANKNIPSITGDFDFNSWDIPSKDSKDNSLDLDLGLGHLDELFKSIAGFGKGEDIKPNDPQGPRKNRMIKQIEEKLLPDFDELGEIKPTNTPSVKPKKSKKSRETE